MSHELSRKQFLSLGVLGGLGLFGACTLDEEPKVGSGGNAGTGSTTSTTSASGGTAGTSSTSSMASGGSGGSSSSTGGSGGSGGTTSAGGSGGGGGASSGNGGSGGTGGSGGKGGSGGSGGSAGSGGSGGSGGAVKDAGIGSCMANPIAAISNNHNAANNGPHYIAIPVADIAAGVEKVYQTSSAPTGTPQSHSHFVKLTVQDFNALRAGMTVTKKSCDSHEHQYAFRCGTMASVPTGTVCTPADFCGTESNPC